MFLGVFINTFKTNVGRLHSTKVTNYTYCVITKSDELKLLILTHHPICLTKLLSIREYLLFTEWYENNIKVILQCKEVICDKLLRCMKIFKFAQHQCRHLLTENLSLFY